MASSILDASAMDCPNTHFSFCECFSTPPKDTMVYTIVGCPTPGTCEQENFLHISLQHASGQQAALRPLHKRLKGRAKIFICFLRYSWCPLNSVPAHALFNIEWERNVILYRNVLSGEFTYELFSLSACNVALEATKLALRRLQIGKEKV